MKTIKRIVRVFIYFFKYYIASFFAIIIKTIDKEKRNIWIISERGDDARDNGYLFFRFLIENYPNKKVYYVIKSKSSDFNKVSTIGNWVEYNSFKHFLYFSLCSLRISSSVWGGDIPFSDYYKKSGLWKKEKRTAIFLQHGITKDYMPLLTADNVRLDLFVCGAKQEYDYVLNSFGHPSNVVKYTGLARYDQLNNFKTKNFILVMPTFRRWLQTNDLDKISNSDYVYYWNHFLNNRELISKLRRNKLKIIFYPHYVMQKNIDMFNVNNKEVIVGRIKDFDVQNLLKECKLLITDFSSVFFDVAYMQKPIIYYQFDKDRYIKEHYDFTKGYFDYERDGFGRVVYKEEDLMKELSIINDNNFQTESNYIERSKKFFLFRDSKNCQRIYDAIMDLENSKKRKI